MRAGYEAWLLRQGYTTRTVGSRLANLSRIESEYGAVDDLLRRGLYTDLVETLTYSTKDARQGRANPTRFDIDGDLRTNLASYKAALRLYKRFLDTTRPAP
jgi:hypothetical protein